MNDQGYEEENVEAAEHSYEHIVRWFGHHLDQVKPAPNWPMVLVEISHETLLFERFDSFVWEFLNDSFLQ